MKFLTWKVKVINAREKISRIEYVCQSCDKFCKLILPINDDPPKTCPKGIL
jgi:predicted nucleic acid-binding Zn ribbon protein